MATRLDTDRIHNLYWSAFPDGERESVSKLAIALLSEMTEMTETRTPETCAWVAEEPDGDVVGHIAFSPVTPAAISMTPEHQKKWQGYILAPLAVMPDYQNQRIGTRLIERGLQQLSAMGVDMLFVYGDPGYYSRFGFKADAAVPYIPPYSLQYPFGWQAIALKDSDSSLNTLPIHINCVPSLCKPDLW